MSFVNRTTGANAAHVPINRTAFPIAAGPGNRSVFTTSLAATEVISLHLVGASLDGQVEGRSRLVRSTGAHQQLGPDRGKPVAVGQLVVQPVEEGKAGLRTGRLGHGHRAVQPYDRRSRTRLQLAVEGGDPRPVRVGRGDRGGVLGGDEGLEQVRPRLHREVRVDQRRE